MVFMINGSSRRFLYESLIESENINPVIDNNSPLHLQSMKYISIARKSLKPLLASFTSDSMWEIPVYTPEKIYLEEV
jgi:hypothetical protein